jgi:LPS export ABC transporter protein LptC
MIRVVTASQTVQRFMKLRGRRSLPVLTVLLAAACGRATEPEPGDFQSVPADMMVVGMQQNITASGIRVGLLRGDTALVFDDSTTVKVKNVDLTIYAEETGAKRAHLTAREGDFNQQTQFMIARGNVVLVTTDGKRIETEELNYDPESRRIWSTRETTLIEPGSRIVGDGFEADETFTNYRITHPRGQINNDRVRF